MDSSFSNLNLWSQLEACLARGPWAFKKSPIVLTRWHPDLIRDRESSRPSLLGFHDKCVRAVSSPVCGGNAMEDGVLNQQTWSPATVVNARGWGSLWIHVVTTTGETNAVRSVLDVGAPNVADLAADSPHRPLISSGVVGVANSVESGLIPGVDGSTPESIARITRKYSLVDAVEGLLNKDPIEFQEVDSIPLSGCPSKGLEASGLKC
ncbi:hypothetical protein Nepgr_033720 [Nepenthes gracilis]|uniref:Uncharacterized protein n=1 Tax=Nepenthes gracilis TaxID=150966 RepID=A0AAD3Y941_NEPGR|nr:hypothetical protein Nepgr_033720 [Nepenthes gracilis]